MFETADVINLTAGTKFTIDQSINQSTSKAINQELKNMTQATVPTASIIKIDHTDDIQTFHLILAFARFVAYKTE